MASKGTSCSKYVVVRDPRRSGSGGWDFTNMVDAALDVGNYSLQGFEQEVRIVRIASPALFARNIADSRFAPYLEMLAKFRIAIVILEFDLDNSLLDNIVQLQREYPSIKFMFAGKHGKEYAGSVFKRVLESVKV